MGIMKKFFKGFLGEEYNMGHYLFLTDGRGFVIMRTRLEMTNH